MLTYSRRTTLSLLGAVPFSHLVVPAFAEGIENKKFIFVLLRGGMDGLSALAPDDRKLMSSHRHTLIRSSETRLNLSNGFQLHSSFKNLKTIYDEGDASFIHACATPHRARSHFDAQDMLELLGHANIREGWLNRVLSAIDAQGLAIARGVPLAMQGEYKVSNWSPPLFDSVSEDLLERLGGLYDNDPEFSEPLKIARQNKVSDITINPRMNRRFTYEYSIALKSLGQRMSIDSGPGIGMVAFDGWDTHANQAGALNQKFKKLDDGILALKQELGSHWANTCIVICSEFGRTVAVNGTRGTDHGTGGLMMLLGGAVDGGKMKGDWPGIKTKDLYQGRDLAPANDVTAVLKGVLRDHLGIDRRTLDQSIFPNSARAFDGLIQS